MNPYVLALSHTDPNHLKMLIAYIVGSFAVIADASDSMNLLKGYEDLSMKVLALGAAAYFFKLFMSSLAAHREEVRVLTDKHQTELRTLNMEHRRELTETTRMLQEVIKANTTSVAQLVEATAKQTEYFEEITQRIVSQHLSPPRILTSSQA